MPIAIIAVVVVAALGAGFLLFTNTTPETAPDISAEVAARPTDETEDTTIEPISEDGRIDTSENDESDIEESIAADIEEVVTTPAPTNIVTTESNTIYADGTYTASASYLTPRRTEHVVGVTLTIEDDIVVNSVVSYDGNENSYSNDNQARFDQAYATEVIGQPLDAISLSRVGGASLTSGAFNEAKAKIVTDARS